MEIYFVARDYFKYIYIYEVNYIFKYMKRATNRAYKSKGTGS